MRKIFKFHASNYKVYSRRLSPHLFHPSSPPIDTSVLRFSFVGFHRRFSYTHSLIIIIGWLISLSLVAHKRSKKDGHVFFPFRESNYLCWRVFWNWTNAAISQVPGRRTFSRLRHWLRVFFFFYFDLAFAVVAALACSCCEFEIDRFYSYNLSILYNF